MLAAVDKYTKWQGELAQGVARSEFPLPPVSQCKRYKRFILYFTLFPGAISEWFFRRFCLASLTILFARLDSLLCRHRALLEAIRLVAGFYDIAVVGQPIQQGRGHLGVDEHARPFSETEICRDHHAGMLVQFGEQVEQQGSAGLAERQISELVKYDQIHPHQGQRGAPRFAVPLFLFEDVDQIDRRIETHPLAVRG